MKFKYILMLNALIFSSGLSQPAPTDAPASEQRILGMDRDRFRATQEILAQVAQDPEVVRLDQQIQRLVERRDRLIFRKAKEIRSDLSAEIDAVDQEVQRKRRGRNRSTGPNDGG